MPSLGWREDECSELIPELGHAPPPVLGRARWVEPLLVLWRRRTSFSPWYVSSTAPAPACRSNRAAVTLSSSGQGQAKITSNSARPSPNASSECPSLVVSQAKASPR